MQVKEALEGRFPGIEVTGGPYPVAPAKVVTAWLLLSVLRGLDSCSRVMTLYLLLAGCCSTSYHGCAIQHHCHHDVWRQGVSHAGNASPRCLPAGQGQEVCCW